MRDTRRLGTELLQDLADKVSAFAVSRLGVDEEKGRRFGEEVAGAMADDWGGQNVYIPMDLGSWRAARNAQIFAEFTGDNQHDLARKYQVSVLFIYRVLKAEIIRRRLPQGSLFEN